jgi:hypothetical protein
MSGGFIAGIGGTAGSSSESVSASLLGSGGG